MHILAAVGGGLLNAATLLIMLNSFQKGEVSRVVPVVCSFPDFCGFVIDAPSEGNVELLGMAGDFSDGCRRYN